MRLCNVVLATGVSLLSVLLYKEKRKNKALKKKIQEEKNNILKMQDKLFRQEIKFYTASAWIRKKIKGISIKEMLAEREIEKIVIYGITDLGLFLLQDCLKNEINVVGIIDKRIKNGKYSSCNVPLMNINDVKKCMDENTYIIIAAMAYEKEIKEELYECGIRKVISLRQLLNC